MHKNTRYKDITLCNAPRLGAAPGASFGYYTRKFDVRNSVLDQLYL